MPATRRKSVIELSMKGGAKHNATYDGLSREQLIRLLLDRDAQESGGIRLTYSGQSPPWQIVRRVKPRQQRIIAKYSQGTEEQQRRNLVIEGENLQAMVSLYKYRGQVDLILTDPPYNTGNDFRYNDKWDTDPNDPDLGSIVQKEDGSRHSKWLRFMTPRLWMMREMLKTSGVLAMCIDHRELYRLGILLDQIFGEENRIGIINWQKSYSPRNDSKGISTATEYVLIYAKQVEHSKTAMLPRTEAMNDRYSSPDGDERRWKESDITARGAATHFGMTYGIQSPFTGQLHYPPQGRCWGAEKRKMKEYLEAWGSKYEQRELDDGRPSALVIKNAPLPGEENYSVDNHTLATALKAAQKVLNRKPWPTAYWGAQGKGVFAMKRYLDEVKKGIVPTTFWSNEEYEEVFNIESTSWEHEQSGHSQTGINELSALVGADHGFETVKPLKLFEKIIQLWCPSNGIVMDPFAGSGTSGHAVMSLNSKAATERRFILIEQGRPDKGDPYARGLTSLRLARAISGDRVSKKGKVTKRADPLESGFRFTQLTKKVDGDGVLALEREEMIDLLLTSYWDQEGRASSYLERLPVGQNKHLIAKNVKDEGFFLVWSSPDEPSILDRKTFRAIAAEATSAGLVGTYHIYARICSYSGPNIEFYQIPHRILEKLGFNELSEPFGGDVS